MNKQRLDKFISNQLIISRSQVRTGIRQGKATVNGKTERKESTIINADVDNITFDGKTISYKQYVYILMNKPKGVLSAATDKSCKTVIDLVPNNLKRQGIAPVGRLDKDTTGLLLITDDGVFAHNCISPKKDVSKTYIVTLDGDITDDMIQKFKMGITLADGTVCKSAQLERIQKNKARVIITEGKYHQIKRMFGVVGLGVNALHRESIAKLKLPQNLNAGECIEITKEELENSILYK